MDWRSLTEVKELGLTGMNCACLAEDLSKLFSVYWYLGASGNTSIPDQWPASFATMFNQTNPLSVSYNSSARPYDVYMAVRTESLLKYNVKKPFFSKSNPKTYL